MTQAVNIDTTDIVGGDQTINRSDVSKAFVDTKQVLEDTLNGVQPFDKVLFELPETVVISGGTATITMAQAYLSAESGTADNLDNINIPAGVLTILRATTGHTLTVRDNSIGAGNLYIFSGGSLILSGEKTLMVFKMGTTVGVIGDGDTNAGLVSYISETALAGENVTDRKAAYIDDADGKIYHIDSDATPPKIGKIRGFIDGTVLSGATATLVTFGELNGFSGLTKHVPIYADSTAGDVTQTRPVPTKGGAQVVIAEMGYARATDTIFVEPKPVQYNLRAAMVQDGTLTIEHHADNEGYERDVKAYISEGIAGAVLEEYLSSNQDAVRKLRDQTPGGYTADLCTGGTPSANLGTASDAFDEVTTSFWVSSNPVCWIQYQFGSGKVIEQVVLTSRDDSWPSEPKDFDIQGSNDGSGWTTVTTITGETGWTSGGETRPFPFSNATAYSYWRINITANNGHSDTGLAEIDMMETLAPVDGPDKLAQTISLGAGETVASKSLYLRKVGSPTGTITIRLETVDGSNDPTGTLAHANATQTLAESSLTTSFADVLSTFTDYTPGAGTYAIVLSTDRAASETNYVEWGCDASAPSYGNGEGKSYDGATWTNETVDFIFAVNAPGTIRPAQISVDWWSSTHADMVNRYDDGAGADLDIKSTFKCTRVSGFDDVTVVVQL